ncbi:MAG: hypothetical protein NTY09_14285 [bacterium]|nr:hypothetical protein [bacterium]
MKTPVKILFIFILFFLASPVHADNLRLNGRYFLASGRTFDRFILQSSSFTEMNLRLNGSYALNPDWKLEFAYQVDHTYYPWYGRLPVSGSEGILDLSWPIDSGANWRATHALDRLSLNYRNDDFTLDIGRQRIAWGTTLTMSFMDMFHPVRPGNPFVPEQPGTDAVRVQIPDGMVSGYDFIYAWLDNDGTGAVAAKYHTVHGDFESGLSVGQIDGNNFVALDTSGDVHDIGIRIESQWIDVEKNEPFRFALESDYAPNNHTYLSGEIFYNGPGGEKPIEYLLSGLSGLGIGGGVSYPARWYAATSCSYISGGLTTFGVIGLFNLTDDSWFSDYSVSHSISDSSDLRIGFQHYEGGMISEYGNLPDMIYVISTSYF